MNHKIKLLGAAVMVTMALGAMMASSASAFNGFTSTQHSTTLSGNQVSNHRFFINTGIESIKCTTSQFNGTAAGTSQTTMTVKPTYGGCTDNVGRTAHIIKNTIEYHLNVTGKNAEGTPIGDIIMTGELEFTVTGSGNCTITIKGSQTFKEGAFYHNRIGTLEVTIGATNIHMTIEGGFFACFVTAAPKPVTANGGEYYGDQTITGGAASISADAT